MSTTSAKLNPSSCAPLKARQKPLCRFSSTRWEGLDMDPVLTYASLACLAVLMGLGALDKLRHFSLFEAAVGAYRLLPEALVRPFSVLFVAAEALSTPLLLWPASRSLGAV